MPADALMSMREAAIRRHGLCPGGTRLLIALSGGSDSVALTLLLQELAEQESLSGSALRKLSILVNQAVILRAGGSPEQAKPWNLPL